VAERARRRDWGEAELDLALQETDCPACFLATQTEQAVLSWMANVNIREPETIRKVVLSRGLCGPHWQSLLGRVRAGADRAVVRLVQHVVDAVGEDLQRGVGPFEPRCPVCADMQSRARSTLEMVFGRLDDEGDRAEFERSFGLCQPHLAKALDLRPGPERARALLRVHRSQLGRQSRKLADAATAGKPAAKMVRDLAAKLGGSQSTPPQPGPNK
jgi:hypothetical protein